MCTEESTGTTRWTKTRCPLPAQNYRSLSRKLPHPLPEWFEKGKQVNKGDEKGRGGGNGHVKKNMSEPFGIISYLFIGIEPPPLVGHHHTLSQSDLRKENKWTRVVRKEGGWERACWTKSHVRAVQNHFLPFHRHRTTTLSRAPSRPLPEYFKKEKQINKGGEKGWGTGTNMLNKTNCSSHSNYVLTFVTWIELPVLVEQHCDPSLRDSRKKHKYLRVR